ncbi:hypothetical protein [Halalkalicoccus subterraneus]|uniref:hypothetical protein n=1 Tax=Halalkalicoccus subterraneus TaxID=2675002 RepID=UPI000EFB62B3|nr:hypothetical protein [Halalkalicoccus subterraneus]
MGVTEIAADARRPEYTGENRCLPCTVLNVLLATAIAVPVGIVSLPAGLALFLACLLAVYLRGYLVPGTPELTKRYLPPSVLRLFGKEVPRGTLSDLDEGLWDGLEDAGVVDRAGSSIGLSDAFREHWYARIHTDRERDLGEADVARMLDAETVAQRGDRAFSIDGNQLVRWDSRAAFLADVAAATVFEDGFEDWSDLDRSTRRDLLTRLRLLLDRCPDCGGPVDRGGEHLDPCCQKSYTVIWSECADCDSLLAERSMTATRTDGELLALVDAEPPA